MIPLILLGLQKPAFDFDVQSGTGLTIRANGVPVVRGSWFQYYEQGYTKGYYASIGAQQSIRAVDSNTVRMTFEQGPANGEAVFRRSGNTLKTDYTFNWTGGGTVLVEAGNLVWAPAFDKGTLAANGKPTRKLDSFLYSEPGIQQRRFSPDASSYELDSPIVHLDVSSPSPLTFFDARGYNQPWAEGTQVWWLGDLALEASKDLPAKLSMEWTIEPKAVPAAKPLTVAAKAVAVPDAQVPDTSLPLLIPKPKTNQMRFEKPIVYTGRFNYPAGRVRFMDDFKIALKRKFVLPAVDPKAKPIDVDAGVSKLGFKPGGYRITIGPNSITVLGEEDEGLRNGWRRLAQLAFVKDGKVMLPTGTLLDQPSVKWRGVHLFVGPQALTFQRNLWSRVLLPLGFNNVVLQCERTDWKSLPGTSTAMTMKREDLTKLFSTYREWLVEPTPLIQSWGHMEWMFANGKNTELAFNKDVLYSIDPRNPEARTTISAIWDEAATLFKPKAMHFGLDEVDMRGWPGDPELVTKIWEDYIPYLSNIAKRHQASMMLWGDKMLAPGEAADAALGDSKEDAARRRAALPAGTIVADWHYKADLSPRTFYPSLQLFKREKMVPIASGWYQPENIKGLATAADIEKVGYLQTTWAGYESNEASMLANMPQFAAMLLAAEYAWGGREENPDRLGYDPTEQFRRMYFGTPSRVTPSKGTFLMVGEPQGEATIDDVRFQKIQPLSLSSALASLGSSMISIPIKTAAGTLCLAVDTTSAANSGEPVAEVEVALANGKTAKRLIRYGQDVRADTDHAATTVAPRKDGLSMVRLSLPSAASKITVRPLSPFAGLRIHGMTIL
jgi:hypothetical protein